MSSEPDPFRTRSSYKLKGLQTRTVSIQLEDVPLQSVGAPSQLELTATSTGPGWTGIQIPPASIYAQFSADYSTVYASTKSTWAPVALALVAGNKSNPEYGKLLADPAALETAASDSAAAAKSSVARAPGELYAKVVEPMAKPVGRYRDEQGRLVSVSDETVGGGMLPVETPQAALMATAETPAGGAVPMDYLFGTNIKKCAKWGATYNDSGLGEDYLNGVGFQSYPARYAKAQIRKVGGADYWIGTLDADGCAPTLFLPYGTYYLHLWPNLQKGTDQFNITLDNPNQWVEWWMTFSVSAQYPINLPVTTSDHETSRIGAVVSLALSNWDPGLQPNKTYRLVDSSTTCDDVGAYASGSYICYGFDPGGGPHTTISKTVIAHEMGHSFDEHGAGLQPYDYGPEAVNIPACRCDHVQFANRAHCLQSWEINGTSFLEAFAQFYAAKVFNEWRDTDCGYAYYKEFRWDNGTVQSPPVQFSCRAPNRWMKNHCDFTMQNSGAVGGVEMDWMTYLWEIHAPQEYGTSRISMADYYGIKKTACTGSSTSMCDTYNANHQLNWQKFRDGALAYFGNDTTNVKYLHLRAKGYVHGVNNE